MSSKTFPSTGEKPKFNPDAAYEAVQDTPVPKTNKPAFNPNKKYEAVDETPPVQQQKQEQQTFKPMTDWLTIPQAAQPMVQENAINDHNTKVAQSKERVNAHLGDIDNSIINIIHTGKKDIQDRLVSEKLGINPKEAGPANPQAQVLESKMRQDIPVAKEEVEDFKQRMSADIGMTRAALTQKAKDIAGKDPVAAKQLKADVYRLDRQNDPSKDDKISGNIEKINNGEYDYDIMHGQLVKPQGFFGSLVTGYKEKVDAFDDYDVYKSGDKNAILNRIKERTKYDPDKAIPVAEEGWATHSLAEMGRGIGGLPIKPLIAGAIAGRLGPQAGAAAAAAVSVPEMYKLTFGSALPHNYEALKKQNPTLSEDEVLQKAIDLTDNQANTDAAIAGAMGGLGAKAGFAPTGLKNALLQKSLSSALGQIGQEAVKKTVEGLGVGSLGAGGQVVKNLMAQKAGIPTDIGEGVNQQLWAGVGMTMAMTMIAKAPELLKPKTYNQLLQSVKNVPKEEVQAHLDQLEQAGQITPEQSQATQKAIEEHQALDNSIKPNVPEADRLKVQGYIKKRNELEASLETTDKAYHTEIKEEIKNLNEQIVNISKGGERGELQSIVDKSKIEGPAKTYLRDLSEKELKEAFKEIASQAHDPYSESQAIVTYGEDIVNKAKELYPKEAPKESKISVIQPGEIKQPEAITIAPKETGAGKVPSKEVGHVEITEHGEDTKTAAGEENGIKASKLSEKGQQEAEELGQYLKDSNKKKIITSEIERAQETGRVASEVSGLPIEYNKVLNTWNIGDYDGKPEGSFIEEAWVNKPNEAPKGGESFNDFKSRMEDAYKYVKSLPGDNHVISHSKVMRALSALEKTGGKWTEETTKDFLNNKELTHAVQEPSAGRVLQHSQEGTGTEGGERGGVEPSQQGEIPAGTRAQEEDKATGSEKGVEPPVLPGAKNVYAEQPPTQLSFRGLQEVANEFGYEDVRSRDRVSDIKERKNAEVQANEWAEKGEYQENIDDLLNRIERREHVPTAKQRLILEQYLANERQKAREMSKNSAEYDRQLLKLQRIKDIGQIARQEAGAALRLPNEGTLPHPIVDESSAMIAKMEANNVDKLTDQQKAEVEAHIEKYKKANDEANDKIKTLEEQVAKLDAQKEFNKAKSTTKRVKKTAEERAAFRKSEIEAAREALRKLRSGESGLSAVPLPGIRELIAIAPHVKNVMVDLVAQGVDNLQDVIGHLHNEFKDVLDGLTEKNIHDIIAGEYNEPGRPLSELQRQVKDLQEEAKLINQIEALENGVEPKSEKAKKERNQKIKALREKIKDLKKEDGAEELRAIKKRNEEQEKKIKEKIVNQQFGKETKKSIFDREDVKQKYPQLRKEALNAIAAKEEAQHEFDLALFNDEMSKRKWYQKAGGFGAKLIHTSKAVMSGIDDSATFVQNGLAILANPKIGAKAFLNHAKDAFSDARFKRELAALHSRPDWEIIKNSGLEIVEPHSAASKQVEEAFEQNLLAQLKIKGVKPWDYTGGIFERAFTSMGNNMRLLLFEKRMADLQEVGKTFESYPKEYKDAARVINELTGRGKLPQGLAQASPYITPFIWAPRMLTSTLNTLGIGEIMGLKGKGYYQNLTPMQRRFALAQVGKGVGIGVAIMGAAALGGAKVDYDPRSVTFGDVIWGNHHYNVFGRFTPVVKVLVQASLGKRIKGGGEEQDLDSGKFGAKTRADVVYGFFRGKTTPAFGTALNLAEGRNYFTNEKFTWKDVPGALIQPMSIKEFRDGWRNDGTATILNRFLPAFEGLKTSDERDFQKKSSSGTSSSTHKTTKTKHTITHKIHR